MRQERRRVVRPLYKKFSFRRNSVRGHLWIFPLLLRLFSHPFRIAPRRLRRKRKRKRKAQSAPQLGQLVSLITALTAAQVIQGIQGHSVLF